MKYLGQCDAVRRRSSTNEQKWQRMMALAKPISVSAFLRHVDLAPLLDESETSASFIRDARRQDPAGTGTYESTCGTVRCWFFQTAGFEFIFLEEDDGS